MKRGASSPRLTVTLFSKGQLTIPAWIARRKGFAKGDRFTVSVIDEDSFAAVRLPRPRSGKP